VEKGENEAIGLLGEALMQGGRGHKVIEEEDDVKTKKGTFNCTAEEKGNFGPG